MIKCIIVDDEKPARDEIAYLIDQHQGFDIVDTFESGLSMFENYDDDVDVLFIDINMPIMNGIEAVEQLRALESEVHVVFITAYDDYAVKAFELNAVDYLLKPVSEDRMIACLERIRENLGDKKYNQKLEKLLAQFEKQKKDHLCFHKMGKIVPVKLDEIIYVKAENKGTVVETRKGAFVSNTSLQEFERKLFDESFFRCHRSYLINLSFIVHIEPWFNRTYQVELEGVDTKIPISRNYVQNFKDLMNII